MFIYDTHCHSYHSFYEPIETILFQMDRNGVEKTLLVQFHGNYDNSYILECKRKYPGRFSVAVGVDEHRPDACEQLRAARDAGADAVQLLPEEPFCGEDPYALWRTADALGMSVSCYGSPANFTDPALGFEQMLSELPNLKIALCHFGGLAATSRYPKPRLDLLEPLMKLARYQNLYIKVPGFGEWCQRPTPFFVPPFPEPPAFAEAVYNAFGAQRMMWASDCPLVSRREGYSNALNWPMNCTPWYTDEDKQWIFGKTALSVFG